MSALHAETDARVRQVYGRNTPRETASASGDFGAELIERLAGREKSFDRYRLEGELARGGQGAILRVCDEDLRRNLAMKVSSTPAGQLVRLDPVLFVVPPKCLEIGYVPIVIRQEAAR